ncbi:phosphatase 2C-like domain-containing protein [Cokeromyces recurvatus]|uniref:phosphatase 2C-like domain-containing protein n=1 Tax=Cokeromyces recurvatus TaxID=90255 RepID=UPI00221EC8C3|nr:phosphatase 2C-like domain-containing protein [Cokeromyces recurvatus]KAI7905854.1 phosphatase 2C-like domain-containing protein [Cokeromyces recurvatus]
MKSKAWFQVYYSISKNWVQQSILLPSISSIRSHLPSLQTNYIKNDTIERSSCKSTCYNNCRQSRPLSTHTVSYNNSNNNNAIAYRDEKHDPTIIKSPSPFSLPLLDFFSKSYSKPAPSYILAHGASGFAKSQRYTTPVSLKKSDSPYYSIQVGEDAYFRRSDAIGVADGIGGWAGVSAANAGLYSRKLMHHAYLELERFDNVDDPYFYLYDEADPINILQRSYEESMLEAQQEGVVGSSTACLAILRHGELRIANLGDSGISVIRYNDYIFRSEEQQHSFNFPYQLGTASPDRPKDAQSFTVAIEKGDIVIMGSDGLFDNLFDKEILAIVKKYVSAYTLPGTRNCPPRVLSMDPQKISDALAERAKVVSLSKLNVDSPFQERAVNEGLYYQGGKADDISVIVAIIKDCEDSPDRRL